MGIEAGLPATGQLFDVIAHRAGTDVTMLACGLAQHRAGSTGLMRLTPDNGDRTVRVNLYANVMGMPGLIPERPALPSGTSSRQ